VCLFFVLFRVLVEFFFCDRLLCEGWSVCFWLGGGVGRKGGPTDNYSFHKRHPLSPLVNQMNLVHIMHPIYLTPIITLCHLSLYGFFPSGFSTAVQRTFSVSSMLVTYPGHLVFLCFVTLVS